MKLTGNRNKFFVLLLLTMCFAIISVLIPYKSALVFLDPEQSDILGYIPVEAGDTFQIKYQHSIHMSNVIESYEVTEHHHIRQYELEYEDFAIGMPSEAGEGEIFEMIDGKYFLKNMNREFEHFLLRVGKIRANHTLIHNLIHFPLSKAIDPGTRVRVEVKKINFIQQMEGVNFLDEK